MAPQAVFVDLPCVLIYPLFYSIGTQFRGAISMADFAIFRGATVAVHAGGKMAPPAAEGAGACFYHGRGRSVYRCSSRCMRQWGETQMEVFTLASAASE